MWYYIFLLHSKKKKKKIYTVGIILHITYLLLLCLTLFYANYDLVHSFLVHPFLCPMFFTDMGSLVLDVLTKPDHLPIARVHIARIAKLSFSHSINGCFSLVSPMSEKLGELQVGNI